jgi:hypothetical protein
LTPRSQALPEKKNVWSSRVAARRYLEPEKVAMLSRVPDSTDTEIRSVSPPSFSILQKSQGVRALNWQAVDPYKDR